MQTIWESEVTLYSHDQLMNRVNETLCDHPRFEYCQRVVQLLTSEIEVLPIQLNRGEPYGLAATSGRTIFVVVDHIVEMENIELVELMCHELSHCYHKYIWRDILEGDDGYFFWNDNHGHGELFDCGVDLFLKIYTEKRK